MSSFTKNWPVQGLCGRCFFYSLQTEDIDSHVGIFDPADQILLLQPKGRWREATRSSITVLMLSEHTWSKGFLPAFCVTWRPNMWTVPACRGCGERGIAVNLPGSYIGHEAAITDLHAKGTYKVPYQKRWEDMSYLYFPFKRWLFSIRLFVVYTLFHCHNTQFYFHSNHPV